MVFRHLIIMFVVLTAGLCNSLLSRDRTSALKLTGNRKPGRWQHAGNRQCRNAAGGYDADG